MNFPPPLPLPPWRTASRGDEQGRTALGTSGIDNEDEIRGCGEEKKNKKKIKSVMQIVK